MYRGPADTYNYTTLRALGITQLTLGALLTLVGLIQVTLVLLHIEEERGRKRYSPPPADVTLYLYLIFICRFQNYEEGAKFLSLIIQFFQSHPVFDRQSYPTLGEGMSQIASEMVAMPLIPKNEIWDLLKTSYLPSVLYKVKQVTFTQESSMPVPTSSQVGADTQQK